MMMITGNTSFFRRSDKGPLTAPYTRRRAFKLQRFCPFTLNGVTSLKNQHLTVVERFVCPDEPGGCVVWNLVFLVGSPMANWSQARGQTKIGSKRPHERKTKK